jgi:hypothetical protein
MAAAKYDIILEYGENLELEFQWIGKDGNVVELDGYAARMTIKENREDASAFLQVDTDGTEIAIDEDTDTVTIAILSSSISEPDWEFGYWQFNFFPDGNLAGDNKLRFLEGNVKVIKTLE